MNNIKVEYFLLFIIIIIILIVKNYTDTINEGFTDILPFISGGSTSFCIIM